MIISMSSSEAVTGVPETASQTKKLLPKEVTLPEVDSSRLIEQKITTLIEECDSICAANPDTFLFFTKYGGPLTQKKLEADKKTDLDLRLVCIEVPPVETQKKIRKQLTDRAHPLPVELYFHSYEKYIQGEVGETGSVTVLEAIRDQLDPEKTITTLQHPSLVSLYTFATTAFFSTLPDDMLLLRVTQALEKQSGAPAETPLQLEDIHPKNILEKITLDEEGSIEWIHLYLKYFLADYRDFKQLADEKQQQPQEMVFYLQRLSKYLLRIAFAVSIMDADLDSIKKEYVSLIQQGIPADQVHQDIVFANPHSWLNVQVRNVLSAALVLRDHHETLSPDTSASLLKQTQHQMENTLLFLSQQAGGLLRRESFEDVHDFLAELAIMHIAESGHSEDIGLHHTHYEAGDTIIQQGDLADTMHLLPSSKAYTVELDGEPLQLNRTKNIFGELGVLLLSAPTRTTTIRANEALETISIHASFFETLFTEVSSATHSQEPILRYFLSSHFDAESASEDETNRALLLFSLCNYFSAEFIQYLFEQLDLGHTFTTARAETPDTLFDTYKVSFLSEALAALISSKKVPHEYLETTDQAGQLLFEAGSNDDAVYFVTNVDEGGGVEISFPRKKTEHPTVLEKNAVIGESALLPGNKPQLYTAVLRPNTQVVRIAAADFIKATTTTDILFAEVKAGDTAQFKQVTCIELFFEVGRQCLKRLQLLEKPSDTTRAS